jgi:hypothetical protein
MGFLCGKWFVTMYYKNFSCWRYGLRYEWGSDATTAKQYKKQKT